MVNHQVVGLTRAQRRVLHDRQRRVEQASGALLAVRQLEQSQRKAEGAIGLAHEEAASLQHGDHAEEFARRPLQRLRDALQAQRLGLVGEQLEDVEALLERGSRVRSLHDAGRARGSFA